ncbi:MAG: hypothetical protein ACR2LT_00055 [Pyrinomonadaceae bacterium]
MRQVNIAFGLTKDVDVRRKNARISLHEQGFSDILTIRRLMRPYFSSAARQNASQKLSANNFQERGA